MELQPQDAKSNALSLIKMVSIAIVILIAILFLSKQNQPTSESPISITIPDDTKLTAESSVLADAAPPTETPNVGTPEVAESIETTDSLAESPASDSATETAMPATLENQVIDIAFNDLYVDYNNLVGKTVRVNGHLMVFGDICSLSESQNLTAVLYTDTSRLSRESRKLILDNCAAGCNVEIEGVVGSVQFLKGITATNLYKIITK